MFGRLVHWAIAVAVVLQFASCLTGHSFMPGVGF